MFIMFPKAWCLVEKINLIGHANPTLQGEVESVNVNTLSRDTASKHLRNTLWTILRDALGKLPVKTCLTDTLGKDAVKTIWSQGTFDGQNACGNTLLDTVGKSGGTLLANAFWKLHLGDAHSSTIVDDCMETIQNALNSQQESDVTNAHSVFKVNAETH